MAFKKGNTQSLGPNSGRWKGGKIVALDYILVKRRDHPYADANGYIREHRAVYEESYNCCLLPSAIVHHKDGNKQNNVWYNLEAMSNGVHNHLHKKGGEWKHKLRGPCLKCGSSTTIKWLRFEHGSICTRCYDFMRRNKNKVGFSS